MNFEKIFELAFTQGVFTNVFAGPILGDYSWTPTVRIGDHVTPTAVPGHPETITFWGNQDGDMVQLTTDQAIARIDELNVELRALGAPTSTPDDMYGRQVAVLDLMLGHMPAPAQDVELIGMHRYYHAEF